MEESENKVQAEKPSYEQLEQIVMQLQQRLMMAEGRLRSIDFASMRLNYLFKVLENKAIIPADFVEKCVAEVIELLTIEEPVEQPEKED